MRRLYLDVLRRRLARGDLFWPLRTLRSVAEVWRGGARPLLGTLIVTYRCDLACAMCDLPRRGDRGRELGTDALRGVLDAFRDLGAAGVGITGGEPLLRPDLADLVAHGSRRGLLMHVNTNGTLVTDVLACRLADSGTASVNVSVDGPDAETHDRLRGRPGSFARALRAVARLAAVPRRPYRIAVTCALGPENADGLRGLLTRAREAGADRVGFLPVHAFPANRVAPSNGSTASAVRELAELGAEDGLLDNSAAYLRLFPHAFAGEPNPVPCAAARASIVVDCYGDIYPCVPLNAVGERIGHGDVRAVWRSRAYAEARERLRHCRACYWNCHAELNLALQRVGVRP